MDPFLDDIVAAQHAAMAQNAATTQREHQLYVQQLRAEQKAEHEAMRVDRFADEFDRYKGDSGALTGDDAMVRIAENQARNANVHRAALTAEQTAKEQLTPIQAQVVVCLALAMKQH